MTAMTISDTERREVARRLRGQAKKLGPNMDAHEFAHYTADVIDVNECMTWHEMTLLLADLIEPQPITGDTSDGYHTFNELYDHRAKLFSVIVRCFKDRAWKSKLHHDGTMYEGMFIVGIETSQGQATYHYDIDPYWNVFDCKELARAPEWDGHTPEQAISRIASLRPSCDRDALLELVKELELGAQCFVGRKWPDVECERAGKHLADDYEMLARRIRKALGVES